MKKSLLILFLSTGIWANAQELKDFLSYSFASDLVRSPSATNVAWVENKEGVRNIWIATTPNLEAKQVTYFELDDGQPLSNLTFTNDENALVYVKGSGPNRRGEFANPALISSGVNREIRVVYFESAIDSLITRGNSPMLSPKGNTMAFVKGGKVWTVDLSSKEKPTQLFHTRASCNTLCWSPEGNRLAFVSSRGDHSFLGVYDLASKALNYLNPSVDHDRHPVWSPDGKQLAYVKIPNEREKLIFEPHRSGLPWSIWVADVNKGESTQVWKADEGAGSVYRSISASNQIFWSADNQIVYPWEKYGWTNLFSVDVASGKVQRLTDGEFEVQFVSMGPQGKSMYYSSNQEDIDRQHIWKTEISSGKTTQLSKGTGVEWGPVAIKDQVVAIASTGTQPASVVKLEKKSIEPLSDANDNYRSSQLVQPEQVIFKAEDGMEIHAQLFKPSNYDPNKQYPGLLFFHGGSRRQMLMGFHHRGYYHYAYAQNQYLASLGYMVLSVNYRSGIGYGMEFREALAYGATGASEVKDVIAAGKYLQARNDIDAKRLGLWGGSYGGYLTAWGLIKAPDMFAAGVDIHGAHDWNIIIKNFIPSYDPLKRSKFAKLAYDSSPIAHVQSWEAPVLLIHGDDDRNVPFRETVDIAEALRRNNVEFEQLIFPDEVHGFLLHQNWLDAYQATAEFFNRKLEK
ncbi:MAG: prolyl oligopeptidase family serine peptidase [Cytophagales bacterium]|nr:prolyl oligopeptidase family serine peptidase [Cytophagales bacterium]